MELRDQLHEQFHSCLNYLKGNGRILLQKKDQAGEEHFYSSPYGVMEDAVS